MARSGFRILRFVAIASVLIIVVFKLSTHNVDLSNYVYSKSTDVASGPRADHVGNHGGKAVEDHAGKAGKAGKLVDQDSTHRKEKAGDGSTHGSTHGSTQDTTHGSNQGSSQGSNQGSTQDTTKQADAGKVEEKAEEKAGKAVEKEGKIKEKPSEQQAHAEPPKRNSRAPTYDELVAVSTPSRRVVQSKHDLNKYLRVNATFVSLARNEDLYSLMGSIREVEQQFNHQYHYDWVFLNDKPFNEDFIKVTSNLVSGNCIYDLIPSENWGFPAWIDQEKAALTREQMKGIIYGDSISYRHMCRFESGFFFRQPALDSYKYYWRVEPDIKLACAIPTDLFKFMADSGKKYGFTISLYEYPDTIKTLWDSTKKFLKQHPSSLHPNNLMEFVSNDNGENYNLCHFWSNFEVADLDFWRSDLYTKFFDFLDHEGGFFYERWGDAPVHSIAASLFLDKREVHYFDDVGYWHVPFSNCPTSEEVRLKNKCSCNPNDNFTWKGYSCTSKFYNAKKLDRPKGWHEQQ